MAYDWNSHYGPIRIDAVRGYKNVDISSEDYVDEKGFFAVAHSANVICTPFGETTERTIGSQSTTRLIREGDVLILLRQVKAKASTTLKVAII